jgi:hypothetical protein
MRASYQLFAASHVTEAAEVFTVAVSEWQTPPPAARVAVKTVVDPGWTPVLSVTTGAWLKETS